MGFAGGLRLWLPKGEYSEKAHAKFIRGAAVQSSDKKNNPDADFAGALQAHAPGMLNEAGISMGDDFFLGRKASSASPSFLGAPRASFSPQPQEAVAGSSEDEARLGLGNDEATPEPAEKQKGHGCGSKDVDAGCCCCSGGGGVGGQRG